MRRRCEGTVTSNTSNQPTTLLDAKLVRAEASLDAALAVLFADNIDELEDPEAFADLLGASWHMTDHWAELRLAARKRLASELHTLRTMLLRP